MKIPKQIKIGAVKFDIINLSDNFEKSEVMGRSWIKECKIKIDNKLNQDRQESIFFHELVHMIFDEGGYFDLSKDEKIVNCLGNGIYQVLKDNNLLK